MAQIGRQPDHLARWVLAGPIPIDHRPHGEGVTKIVDTRSPAMPTILLIGAQADSLAGAREVVARGAVGQPFSAGGDEQRLRGSAKQPVTLGFIADKLRHHRRVERE